MSTGAIVVGTDGSTSASRAVVRAGELAEALGAPVHIVSVYNHGTGSNWMAAAGGVATAELASDVYMRQQAETAVEQALALLGAHVSAVGHVLGGDPADALMTVAADEQAQMIIVGNRGMKGARRVLGSVPNSVSHRASCAVLIVPTQE